MKFAKSCHQNASLAGALQGSKGSRKMKLSLSRNVSGLIAAMFFLAGCGGSLPTIGIRQIAQSSTRSAAGSSGSILYVFASHNARMLSYPNLHLIGNILGRHDIRDGCIDANAGAVYLHDELGSPGPVLRKYRIGGTKPIGGISAPRGHDFRSCSVNPTNGDIATITQTFRTQKGYIAIYPRGSAPPAIYKYHGYDWYISCAYDADGNLYVVGATPEYDAVLSTLQQGDDKLRKVSLNRNIGFARLQWDGQYLTSQNGYRPFQLYLYQISMAGTHGKVISATHYAHTYGPGWIQGDTLVAPRESFHTLGFYNYPDGGGARQIYNKHRSDYIYGTMVVAAPSDSRARP